MDKTQIAQGIEKSFILVVDKNSWNVVQKKSVCCDASKAK